MSRDLMVTRIVTAAILLALVITVSVSVIQSRAEALNSDPAWKTRRTYEIIPAKENMHHLLCVRVAHENSVRIGQDCVTRNPWWPQLVDEYRLVNGDTYMVLRKR